VSSPTVIMAILVILAAWLTFFLILPPVWLRRWQCHRRSRSGGC